MMDNSIAAGLYKARMIQNEKAKEEFIRTFGSLSAYVLDFCKSEGYNELMTAIYNFYIKKDKERILGMNPFTINFENPEELKRLNDMRNEFNGRESMFKALEDFGEAIKEVRII